MKKILVANRGEIALRVMKTAKDMGIATVAIYSEADRKSPHVRYADEAICVGPPASKDSYLRADYIIQKALELGVDGIHPGYGFLSENADFSEKVAKAGITFIGPKAPAIRTMGSKLAAKQAVKNYDIPMVPGTDEAVADPEEAKRIAKAIGFPILIKASAGGGGKGMRTVHNEAELEEQMNLAISEATSSFGDGSVFIEKFVTNPKHIEIQVLADSHGNVVHLFERECSVQRRHQKVVEEAPSSCLTPEVRAKMGAAACDVARACDYLGAGTVEFLVDDALNFYFLEMNTRLQVEHPVTEMITGVDLVREQINIARGLPISFRQEDLTITGHAVELRVYAENPRENFVPDIGKLLIYKAPMGVGVRVDDGFEEGMSIPIYYDPMISKLIAYGKDREEAMDRMLRAISEYEIVGVKNTLEFGAFVMKHPAFREGKFDTNFVPRYFTPEALEQTLSAEEAEIAAAIAVLITEQDKAQEPSKTSGTEISLSNWKRNRT
jgi:acetyl-CoA carboxylase, biotin carboxylase subunit